MDSGNAKTLSQCPQCVAFNLRKSARMLARFYDAVLHPAGIQGTQFSLLAILHRAGELPITGVAERIGVDRTTLTRNLRTLVGRGYVTVDQGKDGRTKSVQLTGAGRDMLVKALPFWEQAQQKIVDGLGPLRFKGLLKELAAIRTLTK